jgi:serine/threonine protein kinase
MDGDPFDLVGDVLEGQFRVDEFIGDGDLSVVYRGHHLGVDATVAIKCLNLPATLDPLLVRPLVESFREASRLHYRLARGNIHIAQSIAAGQTVAPRTGGTVPYLVREWFEGESLASDLKRRRTAGKKGRSVDETIGLFEPAVDGLAYAHRHDVAHLSISPSNLFLARLDDGQSLKVLDFGVAHAMNELHSDLPRDPADGGLRLLFPAYAAPEQLDKTIGVSGTWTDVYALALVVMEALSDRVVMEGTEVGALVDRTLDVAKRPTPQRHGLRLARNLDAALARAVSRAPGKRQKDAATFWNEMKSAVVRVPGPRSLPPAARAKSPTLTGLSPASVPAPGPAESQSASVPPPLPSLPPSPTVSLAPSPSPSLSPAPALSLTPAPSPSLTPAPSPALALSPPPPVQIITARLPPPLPPPPRSLLPTVRLSRAFLAVTGSVTGLLLLVLVVLLVTWPHGNAASAAPVASSRPWSPAATPSPIPDASAPSLAAPRFTGRFPAMEARRVLDATAHDVARCKQGTLWGVAKATVTYANDGSVDHVVVGPPFTGTPTGNCIGETMSATRIHPFGGAPAAYITQFFVPRG